MIDDPVYDKYIAQFRVLIENHGVSKSVKIMAESLGLESQDEGLFDQERMRIEMAEAEIRKLYYEIEKL